MRNKILVFIGIFIVIIFLILAVKQVLKVNKAHTTFENYYAFRGCVRLISKTNNYGLCKTNSGKIIKIVKYKEKWYLDGDLPICYFNICM